MSTDAGMGNIPGGELTRKFIVASYLFSKYKGYGYPQEFLRKLNTQMEKNLEGRKNKKQLY